MPAFNILNLCVWKFPDDESYIKCMYMCVCVCMYINVCCITGEKYSSPRVNLRLHQIKARDEKRSIKVAAAGDVASSNNKW